MAKKKAPKPGPQKRERYISVRSQGRTLFLWDGTPLVLCTKREMRADLRAIGLMHDERIFKLVPVSEKELG